MKNLLTALIVTIALGHTVPAIASEAKLVLRGVDKAISVQIETSSATPAPDFQGTTGRKVRVVLPSPYGN